MPWQIVFFPHRGFDRLRTLEIPDNIILLLIKLPTFIYFIINFLSPKPRQEVTQASVDSLAAMQTNTNIESGTSCRRFAC